LEFSNFQIAVKKLSTASRPKVNAKFPRLLGFLIALALSANTFAREKTDVGEAPGRGRASRALSRKSQQLVRIDVDSDRNVFREWQLVESFADEAAQAHDGLASDQNVKAKLAL
jgi:hypothetical protein